MFLIHHNLKLLKISKYIITIFLSFSTFICLGQDSIPFLKSNSFFTVIGKDTLEGAYMQHNIENGKFVQLQKIVFQIGYPYFIDGFPQTKPMPATTKVSLLPNLKGEFRDGKPVGVWTNYGTHPIRYDSYSFCYSYGPDNYIEFLTDTIRITLPFAGHYQANYISDSSTFYLKADYDTLSFSVTCTDDEGCVLKCSCQPDKKWQLNLEEKQNLSFMFKEARTSKDLISNLYFYHGIELNL